MPNQTPASLASAYTERVIALMGEPGVSPAQLERADDLARLWRELSLALGA